MKALGKLMALILFFKNKRVKVHFQGAGTRPHYGNLLWSKGAGNQSFLTTKLLLWRNPLICNPNKLEMLSPQICRDHCISNTHLKQSGRALTTAASNWFIALKSQWQVKQLVVSFPYRLFLLKNKEFLMYMSSSTKTIFSIWEYISWGIIMLSQF